MRIQCPFCSDRDISEFSYLGDAAFRRPDPHGPQAQAQFVEAVYFRDNPAGLHDELWYHAYGCRSWLRVTRHTISHEIAQVQYATHSDQP
jgi:methylglutamate dehydrogenase subunit B